MVIVTILVYLGKMNGEHGDDDGLGRCSSPSRHWSKWVDRCVELIGLEIAVIFGAVFAGATVETIELIRWFSVPRDCRSWNLAWHHTWRCRAKQMGRASAAGNSIWETVKAKLTEWGCALVQQLVGRQRQELDEVVGDDHLAEQLGGIGDVGHFGSRPTSSSNRWSNRSRVKRRPSSSGASNFSHCHSCVRQISAVAASSIRL